jgi:hypothetical protein
MMEEIDDIKTALKPEYLDAPKVQKVNKVWYSAPITNIRVSVDGGFIRVLPIEYNPLLKELISQELDNAGVYNLIFQKLIPSFDYNPLTYERKFRYRRFVGSPNPEKMEIRLADGTPTTLIVQYDF